MKVTTKGQVTIPRNVREALGVVAGTEVVFVEEAGRFYLQKTVEKHAENNIEKLRGIATTSMTTDEILALTRGD